jgi:hypothetical protein
MISCFSIIPQKDELGRQSEMLRSNFSGEILLGEPVSGRPFMSRERKRFSYAARKKGSSAIRFHAT